jgi:hypothetical protein
MLVDDAPEHEVSGYVHERPGAEHESRRAQREPVRLDEERADEHE